MDDIPIECSAVLDMDSTQVSPEMLLNGAAKNLKIPQGPDPVVISTHGNTKVNNYNNPTFWTCAFPTLDSVPLWNRRLRRQKPKPTGMDELPAHTPRSAISATLLVYVCWLQHSKRA
jgi:hypothetical protein